MPIAEGEFRDLIARLRLGDEEAAAEVVGRFVRRLRALAWDRLAAADRGRGEAEDAVQSALGSFFARQARGGFAVDDWEDLWALLALITVRKCHRRRERALAARRGAGRVVALAEADGWGDVAGREPTPLEAAALADLVARLLDGLGPDEAVVARGLLEGRTADEIAEGLDCSERTVRRVRQRLKYRLDRWYAEPTGPA